MKTKARAKKRNCVYVVEFPLENGTRWEPDEQRIWVSRRAAQDEAESLQRIHNDKRIRVTRYEASR
jgi:hypothetical protein